MRIASQWTPLSQAVLTATASGVVILLLISAFFSLEINGEHSKESGYQQLRRHAVDDDELHDEEIFRAVVQSLNTWQHRKLLKKLNETHRRVKRDEEIVCYGELGCFRDEGPFDYLDMLPSPPEEIATKFMVFTRRNREVPQVFSYFNFTAMYNSHFNASIPTKVIIHGFGSTCNRIWASEMRLALLSVIECNIICVDWENGAAMPNYVRAAVNTRLVGKQVAILILWLNDHMGSQTQDYHLVGFSLGAHVAGFSGQELKNLSRITGLDPAGPLFESYDSKVRLDTEDALFVDVIHSNGDSLLMGGLGSWEPMGHVDFYPNGGRVQKGCSNLFLGAVRDFLWSASDGDGRSLCNHRRAYKFFTESVSPRCAFPAFACDNYEKFLSGSCFTWDASHCGNMGYYADRLPNPKKGLLYLITREDEPFCANQFRITIESSPSSAPVTTYGGLEAVLIGQDFINETFLITQTIKDNMIAGSIIQRMVVAHPAVTDPIQIQLKYTAYQGWIYSGISRWSLERLIITNAYGKSTSFCSRGLLLPSGIPIKISLTTGICINRFSVGTKPNDLVGNVGILPNRPVQKLNSHNTPVTASDSKTAHLTKEGSDTSSNNISLTLTPVDDSILLLDDTLDPIASTSVMVPGHPNTYPQGDLGPTYQLQANDMDWSQWLPLSQTPAMNSADGESEAAKQNNANSQGTPVETFPAIGAEDYVDDVSHINQSPGSKYESEFMNMSSSLRENEKQNGSTKLPAHHFESGAQQSVYRPMFLSQTSNLTAPSTSELAEIRICYERTTFRRNDTEHQDKYNNDVREPRKFTCVDPEELSIQPSKSLQPVQSTASNGYLWSPENKTINRYDTVVSNDVRSAPASEYSLVAPAAVDIVDPFANPVNEFHSIPIPPASFWAAIQYNNTQKSDVISQGADNGINIPPHLQYILLQLDRQGFGPKSVDTTQNVRAHLSSNHYRGLMPSSRALKPRPVVLSGRRQAKSLEISKRSFKSLNTAIGSSPIIGSLLTSSNYGRQPNHELSYTALQVQRTSYIQGHPGQQVPLLTPPQVLIQSSPPQLSANALVQSIFTTPILNKEGNHRSTPRLVSSATSSGQRPITLASSILGYNKILPKMQAIPAFNAHYLASKNASGQNKSSSINNLKANQPALISKNTGYYVLPYFNRDRSIVTMGVIPLRPRLVPKPRYILNRNGHIELDILPDNFGRVGGILKSHQYSSVDSGNTIDALTSTRVTKDVRQKKQY